MSLFYSAVDDVFSTRHGGQHAMEVILHTVEDPDVRAVRMESWPTLTDYYLWSWALAEFKSFFWFRKYVRL